MFLALFAILLMGCSSVKVVKIEGKLTAIDFKNDSLTFLFFTSKFEKSRIEISSENHYFIDTITTSPLRGLATVTSVKKEETKLYIDNKLIYKFKSDDLKKFQMIYISKPVSRKPKYLIEITNERRMFF